MLPKRQDTGHAPGPLYLSLAARLRREIARGILKPGTRLPALAAVAREHNVSVVTVRQAIAVLEQEGLVERRQGVGTFVSDHPGVGMSFTLQSDWESLLRHLRDKTATVLKVADNAAVPMLDPALGRLDHAYRYMHRVHSFSGTPYALIEIYLSQRIFDLDPGGLTRGMVISILSDLKEARVARLRQRISFTTADSETSEHLRVPQNSAIGDVQRVITDEDGRAIYVGFTKYRGDFVKLDFDSGDAPP